MKCDRICLSGSLLNLLSRLVYSIFIGQYLLDFFLLGHVSDDDDGDDDDDDDDDMMPMMMVIMTMIISPTIIIEL